jgi:hypothetical protein
LSVKGLIPGRVSGLFLLGRECQADLISMDEEAYWLGDFF